jgi:hypothetical protein
MFTLTHFHIEMRRHLTIWVRTKLYTLFSSAHDDWALLYECQESVRVTVGKLVSVW